MEPVTSIASLVYASTRYAEHLWCMMQETTPELESGEAEFFVVANDASDEVLGYLAERAIPHVVQNNERLTESELMALGVGAPEYIRRVYQGWNRAVIEARADCLVLLNSDHMLSPGWLAALRKRWRPDLALSPLTIEPTGRYGIFSEDAGCGTGAVHGEHGRTLAEFDRDAFEAHAFTIGQDILTRGGAHQPVMVSKQEIVRAGMYPEGNLHAGEFDKIDEFGDQHLFRKLDEQGVKHRTWHGVVCYHFQEGEMRETAPVEVP